MRSCRPVAVTEAFDRMWIPDGYGPRYRRFFTDAALPADAEAQTS
jgi:hypothetical protein